jgi:SAM-dependent methyltransferase
MIPESDGSKPMIETGNYGTVLRDEAAFADSHYADFSQDLAVNPEMFAKYATPHRRWEIREMGSVLLGDVRGKKLLDLGCGMGEETMYFAKVGADVTSTDISPLGIEITKKRARYNGLEDRVTAFVGDVTATGLPAESFDFVHGLGIIHHVGLEPGLNEARRLLKPGGKAVFLEHMENSEFVAWIKRRVFKTEENYTEHEKPLRWSDCEAYSKLFKKMELYPFYLLGRMRRRVPMFYREPTQKLDHFCLHACPPLRHFAGSVLIYVEK